MILVSVVMVEEGMAVEGVMLVLVVVGVFHHDGVVIVVVIFL